MLLKLHSKMQTDLKPATLKRKAKGVFFNVPGDAKESADEIMINACLGFI